MMGKFLNFRKGWTSKNLRCFQNYDFIKWQIDGETVETVADFIFFGSKITADGDCSREINRCLLKKKINKIKDAYSLEGKFSTN